MSVSLIIPVFGLDDDRLRNLRFLLFNPLKGVPFDEIIVVEQIGDARALEPEDLPNNVKHIKVESSSPHIEKSKLINAGFIACNSTHGWMNDADIVLPFQEILPLIKDDDIIVQPFRNFIMLNEKQTQIFMHQGSIVVEDVMSMDQLGAGSFIMKVDDFVSIRGMDERYRGWGYEDFEFGDRIRAFFKPKRLKDFQGAHLYHAKREDTEPRSVHDANFDLYKRSKNLNATDPISQVSVIHSLIPHKRESIVQLPRV